MIVSRRYCCFSEFCNTEEWRSSVCLYQDACILFFLLSLGEPYSCLCSSPLGLGRNHTRIQYNISHSLSSHILIASFSHCSRACPCSHLCRRQRRWLRGQETYRSSRSLSTIKISHSKLPRTPCVGASHMFMKAQGAVLSSKVNDSIHHVHKLNLYVGHINTSNIYI